MNKQSRKSRKPKKTKGLGAGIIAFGAVFALYSSIFHPHSLGGYILAFVLSGLVGTVVKIMGEGLDLSTKEKVPQSLQNIAEDTGNPEVDALLDMMERRGKRIVVVTNEVGMGLVPAYRMGSLFRDIAGRLNAHVARRADEAWCMISGLPLRLK